MRKLAFKPRFRTYRTSNGKHVEVWTAHKPRYYWILWKHVGQWFEEYVSANKFKHRSRHWTRII
jgi:hypothetical protein